MLDHILRRMGFGASPEDAGLLRRPDPVVPRHSTAQLRAGARRCGREHWIGPTTSASPRGASSRPTPSSTTRASDGCSGWCTRAGRCRRRWRSSGTTTSPPPTARSPAPFGAVHGTKMMDARAAELRRRLPRPGAAVPRSGHRQLPRSAGRSGEGSGDAGVARRPHQRPRPPPGELRPRADGAVHDRHRPLHRGRRLRGGPGLHRLEPRADGRTRQRSGDSYYRFIYNAEPARPDREGIHVRDLSGRGPHDPRACRRAGHAGRPGSDRRAGAPSGDGAAGWRRGSISSSSTTSMPPDAAFINEAGPAYLSSNDSIKAMLQRLFLSERFLCGANVFRATPGRRSSRALDQGNRVARLVGGLAPSRRCRTWASSSTSRRT